MSSEKIRWRDRFAYFIFDKITQVSPKKIAKKISEMRILNPDATDDDLINMLIKAKAAKTAKVGAISSATSAIPIFGTVISMSVGMFVDLGSTLVAQTELVLEIAEVLGVQQTEREKRETVLWIMGIGGPGQHFTVKISKGLLAKLGERFAKRWVGKVVPVAGILASSGLNYVSTYIIGKRAKAYFTKGPEAMGSLEESLESLSEAEKQSMAEKVGISPQQLKERLDAIQAAMKEQTDKGMDFIKNPFKKKD